MKRRTTKKAHASKSDEEYEPPVIESGEKEKILDTYKRYYDDCIAKYGPRTAVLMQVGDFFEMYSYEPDDGEPWTNLREVAGIMLIEIAKKTQLKGMEKPYLMAGVGVDHIGKYRDAVLDQGYVVVFIEQLEKNCKNPPRAITQILTPGTQIQEIRNDSSSNLVVINIENNAPRSAINKMDRIPLSIGMASVDLSTGETSVYSSCSDKDYEAKALDDAYRFLQAQCAKEVHVICSGFRQLDDVQVRRFKAHVSDHLGLDKFYVRKFHHNWPANRRTIEYQRTMLEKVYIIKHGESPIQAIGLERLPHCTIALTAAFAAIYECRPNSIAGLEFPEIWNPNSFLVLEHNAIEQLNLTASSSTTSLFSILNHTHTSMGRRELEKWLLNPLLEVDKINSRLDAVQAILDTGDDGMKELQKALKNIGADTIRLLRRAEIQSLMEPNKLAAMYRAFMGMGDVFSFVAKFEKLSECQPDDHTRTGVKQWLKQVHNNFDIDKLSNVSRISTTVVNPDDLRIFHHGINPEVDSIFDRIDAAKANLEAAAATLSALLPDLKVKLVQNTAGAHYLVNNKDIKLLRWYCDQVRSGKKQIQWWNSRTQWERRTKQKIASEDINSDEDPDEAVTTKARYLTANHIALIKEISVSNAKTKSTTRVTIERSDQAWDDINEAATTIRQAVETAFSEFIQQSIGQYHHALMEASIRLAEIDCLCSHAQASKRLCYHRPTIVENDECSFIEATKLRHPIIERLHDDVEYVPSDISLKQNGLIIFGTNNAGKSSFCKAVALSAIMAQCGCFVPAQEMQLSPFENIITRLSGTDDMQAGRGTFAVEMSELRTILARSTPRSLVLGDEICHGTEYPSAIGIVSSSIIELAQRQTNFLFATHLHALGSIDEVVSLENVHFKHFHVERDPTTGVLTYHRQLRDGSGPATYGIEVAEAQGISRSVIELAQRIRRAIVGESQELVSDARSHYNTKVVKDQCCMPDCERRCVDTHHIREQKEADENGMIDGRFHKNRKHNLTPLCKEHHDETTFGSLVIDGWLETAGGGRKLQFHYIDDKTTEKVIEKTKQVISKVSQRELSSYWKPK